MVCYANASGNSNARRTSRAKHYVVFDRAEDNSAALRARHPSLGWRTVNGLDALPFSIAARLILVLMIEEEHPEVALFAEFPTAQLLSRLWGAVVPLVTSRRKERRDEDEAPVRDEDQEAADALASDIGP